jgi:hypothetical protein
MSGCHPTEIREDNDYDERISDLENISSESRLIRLEKLAQDRDQYFFELKNRVDKLESDHLGQQLDPKVWKFLHEKVDRLKEQLEEIARRLDQVYVEIK